MKLSIVIAAYNSHPIVDRQMRHFANMKLPDGIEIILVDDGSNPPLSESCDSRVTHNIKNLLIHPTNEKRPWTQGLARNAGAKIAEGRYLLMTDIDHILSYEAIMAAYTFEGDKMIFPRYYGVLLKDGTLETNENVLRVYGAIEERIQKKCYVSVHGNTFAMRKSTFDLLGGYPESHCTYLHHATTKKGEDSAFNRKWNHYAKEKGFFPVMGPRIYMFPIGRYHRDYDLNPFGLFHTLCYDPVPQPMKP